MEPEPDEVAGVVDVFGGLTRGELETAFADLAARSGNALENGAVEDAMERALAGYYLVRLERDDEDLLVAGPTSLPTLPEGGEDLPHLLDVERRAVDRDEAGLAALTRLHGDAARAVDAEDDERIATLLDVCYDLEAWAPVETEELRSRLDAAL